MRLLNLTLLLMCAWAVGGCALTIPNNAATLSAENLAIVTEAANIRGTLSFEETRVMSTSLAAETLVAYENDVNALLLATVRAGDPPTVQVVAQIARGVDVESMAAMGMLSSEAAGTPVETYTTTSINPADGCGVDRMQQFPTGTQVLYAVQRAQAVPANTLIGVEFYYGGNIALEDELLVPNYENDICLWFFLEPFSQGTWAVQFFSNGQPFGQRVQFTVGS